MELVVALALHGFAPCQLEPLLNNLTIWYALKTHFGHPSSRGCFPFFVILSLGEGSPSHIGEMLRLRYTPLSMTRGDGVIEGFEGISQFSILHFQFSIKQLLLVQVKHIPLRHHERRTGIILHTGIIIRIAHLLGHPPLCLGQVHPCGDDEEQPQPLRAGRDVGQHHVAHHAPGLQLRPLLFPVAAGIGQVVHVVHR